MSCPVLHFIYKTTKQTKTTSPKNNTLKYAKLSVVRCEIPYSENILLINQTTDKSKSDNEDEEKEKNTWSEWKNIWEKMKKGFWWVF